MGLWECSTENATVATALLADLVERGLDPEQGMLFVLDGSKALRKAVRTVFGEVPVQRCLWHKERNVTQHLPERDRPPIKARMRKAWRETDYPRALEFTQKGLIMRRTIGDRRSIALSLNNLGLVYQDSGQFRLALDAFEQNDFHLKSLTSRRKGAARESGRA